MVTRVRRPVPSTRRQRNRVLLASEAQEIRYTEVPTPLGGMVAAATHTGLCLLEFVDESQPRSTEHPPLSESQVHQIHKHIPGTLGPGTSEILAQLETELDQYFAGERKEFCVPTTFPGTEFQQAAWSALLAIPYGITRSYSEQALAIGRPKAVRAVAKANGDNRIAIVVPCHRVVGADGSLTGYAGLLWRKQALLELEGGRQHGQLSLPF